MKNNLLLIFIILYTSNFYSQDLDYNNNGEAIKICQAIQGNNFINEKAADNALEQILGVIGASKRFVLQACDNINNAVALQYKGVRYIFYDPDFMNSISYSSTWKNMFILAHEVGHHINGHSIDVVLYAEDVVKNVSLSSKRYQELEADEFAGFVLGRLGAPLSALNSVITSISSEKDDSYSTHPKRSKRLAAVKKGYEESGGKINSSNIGLKKGKSVDSKYSNARYGNVEFLTLTSYYSDAIYTGYVSVNSNKPFGYGTLKFNDGKVYEGEMAGGKRNGYGVFKWPDGDKYEGEWVNNWRVGNGTYHGNGYKFVGYWKKVKIDNKEKVVLANGIKTNYDQSTGEWTRKREGVFHNNGVLKKGKSFYPDGRIYEGEWTADYEPIFLKFTDENGDINEYGFLDNSKGNGYGRYTFPSGDNMIGNFKNGYVVSTYAFKKIKSRFSKEYTLHFNDWYSERVMNELKICEKENCNKWGNNANVGIVELEFSNKTTVKRFVKNDKTATGYSETIYGPDEEELSFRGMYYENQRNGYGILKYKDGRTEEGIWLRNKLIKKEKFNLKKMQEDLKRW